MYLVSSQVPLGTSVTRLDGTVTIPSTPSSVGSPHPLLYAQNCIRATSPRSLSSARSDLSHPEPTDSNVVSHRSLVFYHSELPDPPAPLALSIRYILRPTVVHTIMKFHFVSHRQRCCLATLNRYVRADYMPTWSFVLCEGSVR